jgi:tyrosine-protein phosphatase SIW14
MRYSVLPAFLLLSLAAGALGCAARHNTGGSTGQIPFGEKIAIQGISDFGKVDDYLYRGGQPTDEGLNKLQRLGIETIVDLRRELHGLIEHERDRAESLSMHFINLPGSGWATPTDEELARFFSLVREQPRRKIFIHCWLGGDRSGMFVAAYRIAFDGWTPEQAIQEMRMFHYLEFWHPNMKAYVQHFPDRLAHSPQFANFRQATSH